jgi:hypothetical protein
MVVRSNVNLGKARALGASLAHTQWFAYVDNDGWNYAMGGSNLWLNT